MNRWFRRKRTIKLYLFLTFRNFSIHENFSISKICSEKLLFRLEIVYPTSSCSQSFERLTIARKIVAREIVRSRCFEYPAQKFTFESWIESCLGSRFRKFRNIWPDQFLGYKTALPFASFFLKSHNFFIVFESKLGWSFKLVLKFSPSG